MQVRAAVGCIALGNPSGAEMSVTSLRLGTPTREGKKGAGVEAQLDGIGRKCLPIPIVEWRKQTQTNCFRLATVSAICIGLSAMIFAGILLDYAE